MWDSSYRCRESWSEMELEYLKNGCKVFVANTFTPLGKCLSILASFYRTVETETLKFVLVK